MGNKFVKEWITKNYLDLINSTLKDITGIDFTIQIDIDNKNKENKTEITTNKPAKIKEIKNNSNKQNIQNINSQYTFSKFISGSSNQFAAAAAIAVANNPATIYNPLFIYGGVGLGKTH